MLQYKLNRLKILAFSLKGLNKPHTAHRQCKHPFSGFALVLTCQIKKHLSSLQPMGSRSLAVLVQKRVWETNEKWPSFSSYPAQAGMAV